MHQYRIQVVLKPRAYMMLMADKDCRMLNVSSAAARILDRYFEQLPESEQRNLVAIFERKQKEQNDKEQKKQA